MYENERDFKGVWIPKEIWLDRRLNAIDKIILTEIDSLDKGEGGCWASNQYIAEFCQCSVSKVSTSVSKMIKLGYLYVQSFDGRVRNLKSRLSNFERQTVKINEADDENLKGTNITTNTTTNDERKKDSKPSYDDIISKNVTDDNLKDSIYEFIKMRKMIKKPLTDRALVLLLKRLNDLAGDDPALKVKIVEQSIMNNWQGVFPLKKDDVKRFRSVKNTEAKPESDDIKMAKEAWKNFID